MLQANSNRLVDLRLLMPRVRLAVERVSPGAVMIVGPR
jgi:hypothetical protein